MRVLHSFWGRMLASLVLIVTIGAMGAVFVNQVSERLRASMAGAIAVVTPAERFQNVRFKELWRTDVALNDPYTVLVWRDRVFVQDYKGDGPVAHFDTSGRFVSHIGAWGQGPGEFQRALLAGIYRDELLLLFDTERRLLTAFDLATEAYVGDVRLSLVDDPLVVDDVVVSRPYLGKRLAIGQRLSRDPARDGRLVLSSDTVAFGTYDALPPAFAPAEHNPLLKQGQFVAFRDTVYFSFHDTSVLLGYDRVGNRVLQTAEPYHRGMPNVISDSEMYTWTAPVRNDHPELYISLAADERYLYGLFSGTQVTGETRAERIASARHLDQGEIINVFDRRSGEYLCAWRLPVPLRRIYVSEDALYGVSADPEIGLIKYEKPAVTGPEF